MWQRSTSAASRDWLPPESSSGARQKLHRRARAPASLGRRASNASLQARSTCASGVRPLSFSTRSASDARPIQHQFVIQQFQGLRGGNGGVAPRAALVRIRHIEDFEHRIPRIAPHKDVDAAALALRMGLRPSSIRRA